MPPTKRGRRWLKFAEQWPLRFVTRLFVSVSTLHAECRPGGGYRNPVVPLAQPYPAGKSRFPTWSHRKWGDAANPEGLGVA
jgi:hypothetical protein